MLMMVKEKMCQFVYFFYMYELIIQFHTIFPHTRTQHRFYVAQIEFNFIFLFSAQ